jgi:hypothetical protein
MSETPDWAMIGVIIGAVALLATLITLGLVAYDVFRPERRKRKLRTPGVSYFIIPCVDHHECSYAYQNELEHRVKEITIPPHSESIIDFIIIPSMDFNTSQIIFACEEITDRPNLASRPQLTALFNRFFKIGPRRYVMPSNNARYEDYIDKYYSYHMVEEWRWSVGTIRALGFKIKTNNPGRFRLSIFFTGETIEARISDIVIRVGGLSRVYLYCVDNDHKQLGCAAGIRPKG